MDSLSFKKRYIRSLPGRLRVEVYGLKGNPGFARELERTFTACVGITSVVACTETGRMLILYNEAILTSGTICSCIRQFEEQRFIEAHSDIEPLADSQAEREVACAMAAVEVTPDIPEEFTAVPVEARPRPQYPPLALTASVLGFGVLGAMRLLGYRSALATHGGLFQAAGVLSVVAGYPFLKRGVEQLTRDRKVSADLLLGTAALALALVRENVVALATVSVISFLEWQRSKTNQVAGDPSVYLTAKTKAYASKATKLAFGLAGVSYAVTRNPMIGLGVLLAANPRPCLVSEEYAWKNAEHTLLEKGVCLPRNQTLTGLAETEELVVEDSSHLFCQGENSISCYTADEESRLWCMAGSLLSKSSHPMKTVIMKKAEETGRTKRTPFEVEETEDGVQGKINGQPVYFGTKAFLMKHHVDCQEYELAGKRHKKNGCTVYYLGTHGKCIGLILLECPYTLSQTGKQVKELQEKLPDLRVRVLGDSLGLAEAGWLQRYSWQYQPGEVKQPGLHLVHSGTPLPAGVPFVTEDDLPDLGKSYLLAKHVEHVTAKHRRWTIWWNVLGSLLVIPGRLAAPLANLIGDGLKLVLLTWSQRASIFGQEGQEKRATANNGLKGGIPPAREGENAWHAMTEQEVLDRIVTDGTSGLTDDLVAAIRSRYGENRIIPPSKPHWLWDFFGQFREFTTMILFGTAAISVLSGDVFDGVAMAAVLLTNAVISVVQERKAGKVVDALNQFQAPVTKVIRDGMEQELSATELVPGDVVVLEAGECVPADIRLLSDWNLEVNEAALTGESLAVCKQTGVQMPNASLADRSNMLYMGTNVTRGKAVGLVVETGMNTQIGYLTLLLKQEEKQLTPLQERITSISKRFVKGAFLAGALVFAVGMLRGNTIRQMISTSVALVASAIPEGLPVTITIALSAGIFRMAKRNAVIRKLSALETLGRVTVICSDKTGTLTKNEMTVTRLATADGEITVTGEGYAPKGELQCEDGRDALQDEALHTLLRIAVLCNNSQLLEEDGQWTVKGDPTEGALHALSRKAGISLDQLVYWKRKHEIPFDSANGTMSVVCHDDNPETDCMLMSKGSVETILKKCVSYESNGEILPLSDTMRGRILEQNNRLAGEALRVLGFAYRPLHKGEPACEAHESELIYVGMAGMIDPPKAEVDEAIREAFQLGVKPVMITGDHPVTAVAIGHQLGMYRQGDLIITGNELDQLSDVQLNRLVGNVSIFARVSPEHKLRIVQAYQRAGHVVAMTGDGVNDAPAIKKADVGIAMGRTGTEVTKQTADMVLQEDHFGTIVDGVKESRTIISNIRKAIGCLLTGNLAEILVSSLAVITGMPIPLVPVQILLMNLLTDALPAAVLAVNPGNKKLITGRQDIVDKSLYRKVAIRGLVLGLGSLGLFAGSLAMGAPLVLARTMAFATLVAGQLMQTFSWRQENGQHFSAWTKDRFMLGALGISWAALLAVVYVPTLGAWFHTVPLGLHHMALVITVGSCVSIVAKPLIDILGAGPNNQTGSIRPNLPAAT